MRSDAVGTRWESGMTTAVKDAAARLLQHRRIAVTGGVEAVVIGSGQEHAGSTGYG